MSATEKTEGVSTLPLFLPQDILIEILSKLPAKSLIRLSCVSKFFCALRTDHGFGVMHRSLSLTLPSRSGILIAISRSCRTAFYTINFSEENPPAPAPAPGMLQANRLSAYLLEAKPFLKGHRLRSSSDGLICLFRPNGDIAVCNVSTGQRISLPTIQSHYSPYLTCALLGFDSQSKRYKVLMSACRGSTTEGSGRISFEYKHWVLTLGVDKSWREMNYNSHLFYPFNGCGCPDNFSDTSVCIDGVIYFYNWLTKDDPPSFHIVAFDVGSESYSLIPLPPEIPSSSEYHSTDAFGEIYQYSLFARQNFALLQVDGGRLAIVFVRKIGDQFYMYVWTWEKSKESWENITMIIPLEYNGTINKSLLYTTTNHAGEIVLLCTTWKQFFILVCNLKSEVWRAIDVCGEFPNISRADVRMYRTMDNVFSLK